MHKPVDQNKSLLRQIFDDSPIGISIISVFENERLLVNKRLAKMFGAGSVDELLHHNIAKSWVEASRLEQAHRCTGATLCEGTRCSGTACATILSWLRIRLVSGFL